MTPFYCKICTLWVGLEQWLVRVSWLVELASVFWWVELNSLEFNEVYNNEFWGVCGLATAMGSLYFNAQVWFPVFLEN